MKYLDKNTTTKELHAYLLAQKWIDSDETILFIEKPGEGNMNVVLRVKTNKHSVILKQSRPFVQKYQQIAAPLNRIAVEYQFYRAVNNESLEPHLPKILGYDTENYVLLMEDLGHCEDMSSLYASREIDDDVLKKLVNALSFIHQTKVGNDFPENLEMRRLNYQHIFLLPFIEDNGFELDTIQEGLQALSIPYKMDKHLKSIIDEIGNLYLSKGNTLLHGDYYPGSWMKASNKLFIIDPEFGFAGFAEFDLGVMAAHIIMATSVESYLQTTLKLYGNKADQNLVSKVAGIEIMRRIIGLAQLPIDRTLAEKQYLLEFARKMVLS